MDEKPLLILSVLLAACGPDKLISDLPSPNGQYHVEVRKCPEKGSITWGEEIQVSLLETGKSEKCHAVVRSLAQFDLRASADQLQRGGCPIRNSGPGTLASSPGTNRTARA